MRINKITILFLISLFAFSCGKNENNVIKLGAIFPFTGEVGSAGQRIKNGIDLAIYEANKSRRDKPYKIIYEDDQNKPALTVSNAMKLIDIDRVVAILGSAASGCTMAMMPYAIQHKTVVFSPISSSISLSTEGGGFFFRVAPADDAQAKIAFSWILKQKKGKIAIVYVNNDWGKSLAESVRGSLENKKLKIVAFQGVTEGQKDMRTIIEVVKQSNANILYSPTYPVDGGLLVRQAKELGLSITMVGGDNWGSPEFQTTAGDAVNGCYLIKAINPSGKRYHQFEVSFKKRYGKDPDNFATWSYDATKILLEAINKTDGKGGEILANVLRQTNTEGASGKIAFDEHGDLKYPRFGVFKYVNGSIVSEE